MYHTISLLFMKIKKKESRLLSPSELQHFYTEMDNVTFTAEDSP